MKPTCTIPESSSLELGTIRTTSQQLDIKTECEEQDDQSSTLHYGKIDNSGLHAFLDQAEDVGVKNMPVVKQQVLQINS